MYIKKIDIKQIFDKFASLNWGNYHEIKVALVIDKNDSNEKKNIKIKAKQFKNKKQCLKHKEKKEKIS